ncbi:MAG: alkaline phosphatase PhoX [Cytophagales bacterium]
MKHFTIFVLILSHSFISVSQSIADFKSVKPLSKQPDTLVLPKTHTFQYLIKTDDDLMDGRKLGSTLDFTGYVPIDGSKEGWLSISSENEVAETAILKIKLDATKGKWEILNSGKVDYYSPFVKDAIHTVSRFCSGTVTPWGTVIVAEENDKEGDGNKDGYHDVGWLIELNPYKWQIQTVDPQLRPQKLWAMGRFQHENVVISSDNRTCYMGADSKKFGYVYKYVAKRPFNLAEGDLYVLCSEGKDVNASNAVWKKVPNNTTDERNNTNKLAEALGATHYAGVEDVEIGPDGLIYFACKYSGRIYRMKDLGEKAEVEVFVESQKYDVLAEDGKKYSADWHSGETGSDNLAFDGEGNLWVCNDGGNNAIWVVRKGHTLKKPKIELFAETPKGCEPTGITFSPDFKYLFLSLQNPNSVGKQKDKFGKESVYDRSHTIVIERK